MSATGVATIVGAVLLAGVLVFLIAVLRSHAEILRRLGEIDARLDGRDTAPGYGGDPLQALAGEASGDAPDIAGETLAGDSVKIALGPGSPRTLLAFLSSGCAACGPLWEGLRDHAPQTAGARVVVVTKGSDGESVSRLERLAPAGREVVMSTAAWRHYAIEVTPQFVLVDGGAREILGRGSATSWEQLDSLLTDAQADSDRHRSRGTSQRAARAEQALAAAGITPGHPSLYPSQHDLERRLDGQS